jgi:DNA-binding transcriptional LysR family regulator
VLARQADFGLMADEMPTVGLEHSEFARFPGVVVMHAKHRLAKVRTVQPRQIAEEPFIALNPEDASRRRLERALAEHNVGLVVTAETPYAASVCEMALQGLGIGVVNPITALEYARRGLVVRPLSLDISFAGLLVLPPGQPLSSVAQRLLQLMRILLAEEQKALDALLRPRERR